MANITHGTWIKDGKPVDKVLSNGKQVYGRNLIRGSYNSSWSFTGNGAATIQKVTMDSGEVALHVNSTDGSGFWAHFVLPSGTYTISVEVKGTGTINKLGWENKSDASMDLTTDWQRVSRTASIDSNYWWGIVFYGTMNAYVRFLKVEQGDIATPYSLAPEDVM